MTMTNRCKEEKPVAFVFAALPFFFFFASICLEGGGLKQTV